MIFTFALRLLKEVAKPVILHNQDDIIKNWGRSSVVSTTVYCTVEKRREEWEVSGDPSAPTYSTYKVRYDITDPIAQEFSLRA